MKKTLSVVLAIAMVFVMSLSVFAAEKPSAPADVDAWTAYYAEVLADETVDPLDVAAEVAKDVATGAVEAGVAVDALEAAAMQVGSDYAQAVVDAVADFMGITNAPSLPDFLPEDTPVIGGTAGTVIATVMDIVRQVLGVVGEIAGSLFGGNDADELCLFPTKPETTTEAPLPEEPVIEDVPELGDNSILAIGAVALVAGAALVLTRKKDKDAE